MTMMMMKKDLRYWKIRQRKNEKVLQLEIGLACPTSLSWRCQNKTESHRHHPT